MSNHWHILLEVPTDQKIDDSTLYERIRCLYSKQRAKEILEEFKRAEDHRENTGSDAWIKDLHARYLCRMGDLSIFVKELKERFSKWYNRKHDRRGTLWEERFKSVLIENSENSISTMATYIDLNPVRAGIVKDPRDYRFCGYAEAVAGYKSARQGIQIIVQASEQEINWRKISARYRMHLFCSDDRDEEQSIFKPEAVKEVLNNGGELGRYEIIRCRVRYFSDGVALGSKLFIEEVFENNRRLFSKRRKTGARKMRGGSQLGLCSLRDLSDAIMAPG